jgi:hypothetical protein
MAHMRAADDFQAIRARMEELWGERERAHGANANVRPVRLSLCRANGDPIIISIGPPRNGADRARYWIGRRD